MAADWTAIRLEYVHGTQSMREVAEKHGIKAAGLMRKAALEGWDAQRKQQSAEVSRVAAGTIIAARVDDLSQYNAEDLDAAKRIRAKALEMLDFAQSPQDIKAISGAVDTASKVARLALGVPTENSSVTTKELPATLDDFLEPAEPAQ